MKPFQKISLILAAVVVGGLALALIGVNLYVQSKGTKERIQLELTRALGEPMEIQRATFSPWGGLTISEISSSTGEELPPLLAAKALRVRFELSTLFSNEIVIREIALIEPRVVVSSHKRKKKDPTKTPDHTEPPKSKPTPAPTDHKTPATTTDTKVADSRSTPAPTTTKPKRVKVTVRSVVLKKGSFRYKNRNGRSLAYLEGIEMHSTLQTGSDAEGTLNVRRATLESGLQIENIRSPFTLKESVLNLSQLVAETAKGTLNGTFQLDSSDEHAAYDANLTFKDVDLPTLLDEMGLPGDRASGNIVGSLELRNPGGKPETLSGKGAVQIRDGQVQQFEMFQTLGQMLKIEELVQFNLEDGHLDFTIDQGVTNIDDLLLQSKNLRIAANGPISRSGELDLKARLFLHKKIRRRLPDLAKGNMEPDPDDKDFSYLDFDIEGTASHPTTNIIDRLVGKKLEKKVNSLLKNLFGGSLSVETEKDDEEKDKK